MDQPEVIDPPENEAALYAQRLGLVRAALEAQDEAGLKALLEPLHPADIADILEQIGRGERARFFGLLGDDLDADVLSELDESVREEIVATLPSAQVAEAVAELETDDVVDFIENLEDEEQAEAILDALEDADRVAVERALSYPEYSAGRLMQREVVMAPEHWTVGEAIDYLRASDDLPEQFYHLILVDPKLRPTAYVTGVGMAQATDRRTARGIEIAFAIGIDQVTPLPRNRHRHGTSGRATKDMRHLQLLKRRARFGAAVVQR